MKLLLLAIALGTSFSWAAETEPARIVRHSSVPIGAMANAVRTPGSVELELDIDAKGNLKGAKMLKGRPDLGLAALRAVREWKFAPAQIDGRSMRSKLSVLVNFDFGKGV